MKCTDLSMDGHNLSCKFRLFIVPSVCYDRSISHKLSALISRSESVSHLSLRIANVVSALICSGCWR